MADLNQVRRRADEFARLVDGAAPPPNPVQDPEFHTLVTLVEELREAGDVQPAPDFSATLRQRLVEEHAARITANPNPPEDDFEDEASEEVVAEIAEITPMHGPRHRRGRLIAGAAAFVVLAGGIGSAAAAQQSMPGDTLYGLKRSLESVASKVSVTEDSRGRRELSHALARLTEAEQLVTDKAKAGTVSDTLGDFSTDARSGGDHLISSFKSDNDATTIEKIYVFAEEAQRRLVTLARRAPVTVRPAIGAAYSTVTELVRRAVATCPACDSPKTGTTISPDSVKTSQNPTEPSNPTAKDPEQTSTDLASPEISIPPTVAPTVQPTGPNVPSTSTTNPPGLPSLPVTLPTSLPVSLPVSLPTTPPRIPLPTISVSLPLFNLPTLSLPLPTITLPPLLPKGLHLLPTHPATTTSTGTAKSKSSATPSKPESSTTPSKTASKTSPIAPSKPTLPVPSIPKLPWPWFTTMPSSPQHPTPTVSVPTTPSQTPTSTPTATPTETPTASATTAPTP